MEQEIKGKEESKIEQAIQSDIVLYLDCILSRLQQPPLVYEIQQQVSSHYDDTSMQCLNSHISRMSYQLCGYHVNRCIIIVKVSV